MDLLPMRKELRAREMDGPFVIWPEEAAPPEARQCERCELSKQRSRVIWGEGNPNAPILFILDNPGAREDLRRPIRAYRKPEAREACRPHLQMQLLDKRPLVLFGFGNIVAETLLPGSDPPSVKELRGEWREYGGIPIGFTYHPLAVRRRPNLMNHFVEDLKGLKRKWDRLQSGSGS